MPEPYYDDGTVTIYHGDCRGITLPRGVIITDPPYGTGAYATDQKVLTGPLLRSWVAQHDTVAVFGWPEWLIALCGAARLEPQEWVTWWPTNKPGARTPSLAREVECIAVFGPTPGATTLMRPRSADVMTRRIALARGNDPDLCRLGDVWRDESPGAGFNGHLRLHPNEKPLTLMSKLVQLCSNPHQLVIDPFCGSGTTLRATKDLGRRAIGIEIEEHYCEIAAQRMGQEVLDLRAATPSLARAAFDEDGQ